MSDKLDPLSKPSAAAHESVLELIKAGKIIEIGEVTAAYTHLVNHYRSELKRIRKENEVE
ncbi:hypothetical protein [Enterobacter mori]|uniref:hypothetical protein n=1 Tax=Enterobacter mori TaxID=539813 RepID=UPI000E7212B4|nr:hypothetical protein [Enterobacter mori]KAA1061539.1 hypothetical protein D5265_011385 [Enterobacter mori]